LGTAVAAPVTSALPKNDDLKWHGKQPHLTAHEKKDIAALEARQQKLLASMIKDDPQIMGALHTWKHQSKDQKLAVLRRIAALEGQVFHFTPAPMTLDPKKQKGDYGAYDGDARKIELGSWGLKDPNPRELVDTVVHEQLHALQHQRYTAWAAGRLERHNPQAAQAQTWLYNNVHYHEFEKGPKAYREQPVEAHAWNGAAAITDALFGPKKAK